MITILSLSSSMQAISECALPDLDLQSKIRCFDPVHQLDATSDAGICQNVKSQITTCCCQYEIKIYPLHFYRRSVQSS